MYFRNILSTALIILVLFSSPGSLLADIVSTEYGYTNTIEAPGRPPNGHRSITVDSAGNVYMVGTFDGTDIDFDPSVGTDLHTSVIGEDFFITKVNSDGTYGYTQTLEIDNDNHSVSFDSIATDSLNNVYIVGFFAGTDIDLDPSGGTDLHTSVGGGSFLIKLSFDGTYVLAKIIDVVEIASLALDSLDNIYLTGNFNGTDVDFDPSGGTDLHTSIGKDIFLTKINADGSYGYTEIVGHNQDDFGKAVYIDSADNIYVVGNFGGVDVDFDFTGGTDLHTGLGTSNIFLTKINADGSYGYTKSFAGADMNAQGKTIVIDSSDNVYIAGFFNGTDIDFDPTGGTDLRTSVSSSTFLIKINADGSYGYTKVWGESSPGNSLSTDEFDNVYVFGEFSGTDIDFDSSGGADLHTSNGSTDIFLTKINADGSYGFTETIGGINEDNGHSIILDESNNIYIIGGFDGTDIDFNPYAGTDLKTSVGGSYNFFLTKFSQTEEEITPEPEEVRTTSGSRPRTSRPSNYVTAQNSVESKSQSKFVYNLKIGTKNTDKDKIKELQKYLESKGLIADISLESNDNTTLPPSKFKFLVDFKLDANIPDVKELQKYLNANGFPVATTGPGSIGNESTYFGPKTKSALMLFQKSKGLVPDGIMGPITRAALNAN